MKLSREGVQALVEPVRRRELTDEQWELLGTVLERLVALLILVEGKGQELERLVELLPGYRKRKAKEQRTADEQPTADRSDASEKKPRKSREGIGRTRASEFAVERVVECPHPDHQTGLRCDCGGGLYRFRVADHVQVLGGAVLRAVLYRRQVLRCWTCGRTSTAPLPAGVPDVKYDASADATFAVLRYAMGMPFNRLATILAASGIPVAASKMFAQVAELAGALLPVYLALQRLAAQADLIHTDDTTGRVLSLAKLFASRPKGERRGIHTTGVVAVGPHAVSLFYTGWRHAGENLDRLLARRAGDLAAPIHMADALSRNTSKQFKTIVANCLAHGFRKFVELEEAFPTECGRVLSDLGKVFEIDDLTRGMSKSERLAYHQLNSGPLMEALKEWLLEYESRAVEPNSVLGKAFQYLLNHWDELTAFLRIEGAPLHNNLVERLLKVAIRHRKNSLFYKTQRGAFVGDVLMSVIHTCRDNGVNPFAYLTAIGRNSMAARQAPEQWLPWVWAERQASESKQAA